MCELLVSEFRGQIFTPGSFSSLKLGNRKKNINKANVPAKNQSVNAVMVAIDTHSTLKVGEKNRAAAF